MEETILDILLSKDDWDHDKAGTAKEITEHIMQFMGWVLQNFEVVLFYTKYYPSVDKPKMSIQDIYQFWLTEIHNNNLK
jgi:hypothetical protein